MGCGHLLRPQLSSYSITRYRASRSAPRSRTHAYARFLTPYFRGHIGFLEPVPCWFYNANRPRAGKDYLSGITQITYEGFAFEDAALSDSSDETRPRVTYPN